MTPEELERTIACKIESSLKISPDDTLLGFLDVDENIQKETIKALRGCSGRLDSLKNLIAMRPATASYGLAVAAPIGLQDENIGGGAFYAAWESAFGMFPDNNHREPLARDFLKSLSRLGLPIGTISPDHELHWHGGCYLFHAAILPHFVAHLRNALESAQSIHALPDPSDDELSANFARILSDKVPPGQLRLKKILESKVGSFLVRRLVRWHITGDSSLFPAHIQPLLQDRERWVVLRSPFIAFDETEGKLQLILPAQSSTVADNQTRWIVGESQFRASSERPPIALLAPQ